MLLLKKDHSTNEKNCSLWIGREEENINMIVSELKIYNFRRFKSVNGLPGLKITFHKGLNALMERMILEKQQW